MANLKKAIHHHGKAGDALRLGDLKAAAHHMGHALAALRTAPAGGVSPVAAVEVTPAKPLTLRKRLGSMKPKAPMALDVE